MAEIKDLVHRVVVILDAIKLSYVIVGGFAAIMRSIPRTTMDLDIIIENDPVKISLFLNALKTNDFDVMDEQVKMAMNEGSSISIFDAHSPLRVDIKIARKTDDIDALKNGTWETYDDIKMRIASPELILFGKVLYIGDISTETDADLLEFNDVRDFINVYMHSENLNMGWLNAKVAKKRLTETYNRLMALATKEAEQS
jgi:hypothetical protein